MNSHSNNIETETDALTIKDVYLFALDYLVEIRRCWLIIVLCLFIFIPIFVYQAWSDKNTYEAELTFMVNEDETASSAGGLGGLIGGLGLGGIGQSYNIEKILSLAKSRRILVESLLNKAKVNDRDDYLANHLINHLDSTGLWHKRKWFEKLYKDRSEMRDFRFVNNPDSSSVSRMEQSALNSLAKMLGNRSGGLLKTDFGDKDLIMSLSLSSSEEDLALEIVNSIFATLSRYYIEKTVEKQSYTYNVVKIKADSIAEALEAAEYNYANFRDRERGMFESRSNLPMDRYKRDIQKYSLLYAEVLKNLEIADFTLKNKTPFIQVLDGPVLPLPSVKKSISGGIISGFIIAILFSLGFIVSRKFIRNALK